MAIPATPSVELPPPPPPRVISESELSEREAFQAVKEHFAKFYQISDVSRGTMADTVAVASRIKEELRSRNLQQKLIGELVLDVGQGERVRVGLKMYSCKRSLLLQEQLANC